ncbi:MAG: hypothetical protein ACQESR_07980 [Planctomycetota bacterium]
MNEKLSENIARAVSHQDRPLEVCDAAGKVYFVMTSQQFQKYVYDDSDLTPGEMVAAAASHLDAPEGWGAAGMDDYDQDEPQASS